ncbi:MAG: rod shape-determining protein RodA [Candidatus Andersenbacteria bacterium]
MRLREVIRSLDWVLVGAALLLVCIGLAMLFSATYTQQGLFSSRFMRQGAAFIGALGAALLVTRIPYHTFSRYAPTLYVVGLAGLVIVYLTAQVIRGTASRLSVIGLQLQPSEFMKVTLVVILAWLIARRGQLDRWTLLFTSVIVGLPVALIMLEPDLGVAILLLAVWVALIVFMGLSWRAVSALGIASVAAIAIAWRWLFVEYQKDRLLVFLDPTSDPLGAGYNIVQSIVALGSGRLAGRGLGHGPQSQLQFLPEQHTDFILASIGEELGFVGVSVVIILYVVLLWRILHIARSTRDLFGQLLAVGSFLVLFVSFVVSVGMNMGLLPVTGIPLPLVSYGGSNLVSTFLLLAIVESVHVHSKWVQPPPVEISYFT